ncbi:MAG: hypothetical protein ACP5E9_00510 [Candidatus Methanospirareceae archaeon]
MSTHTGKISKRELTKLLERESSILECLRAVFSSAQRLFNKPEVLDDLTVEIKDFEADIVKRYFFPVDKTIDAFTDKPQFIIDELSRANEADKARLLHYIELLEKEVGEKEAGVKAFRAEVREARELLAQV